jgi:hypothetical protein
MVNSWLNSDGLYRKFGTSKATAGTAGEYHIYGQLREVELVIDLTTLTQTETIQSDTVFLPVGARIQEVELRTETAGVTGTAIDVGLIKASDRTTEVDYDGLLAAAPIAIFNSTGERTIFTAITTVPASATGTGALIGTTLAYNSHISASMTDATSFTAGKVHLFIRYYMP